MHKRNIHFKGYDLERISSVFPAIRAHLIRNPGGKLTVNFSDPVAVKILNQALLIVDYGLQYWDIPDDYLYPAVPGRADYIHCLADLLYQDKPYHLSKVNNLTILDIGTGANCIYPLLGNKIYNWNFVGSDISDKAIIHARQIILKNNLESNISIRKQPKQKNIFKHIVKKNDQFWACMCNPPFYKNAHEAQYANQRKNKNLNTAVKENLRNFGGYKKELVYPGGEVAFIMTMIHESKSYSTNIRWFTCLISNQKSLIPLEKKLNKIKAIDWKTLPLQQGNKKMRILVWKYK